MNPVKAFAPVRSTTRGATFISMWGVSSTATEAREKIGRHWNNENPRAGWEVAKKEGYRIRRVLVTLDTTETD
ncbi:hypothetical protein V5F77_05445 [Xanthobacter sp. DSM 24535]|uniref:hypothetical protein n=1 Tax=Roseixanthobacter psychrophilus TaxID=3119917 RepID=UPI00372C2898